MGKYEKDELVLGLVTGIESYGIFIGLDEYYSGLIHISEISNDYVRNISNYVRVGETIKAKVLESDDQSCHVKLSIKDIDYRVNKRHRDEIVETGSGFEILKDNLSNWISEREK